MLDLWPFQIETNRKAWRAYLNGANSVLLQAPTGSGKTVMASHLIKMRLEHCREHTLVLAHRREIVTQTANKLEAADLTPEIIMAGHSPNPWANVMVGSVQTIWSRKGYAGLPDAQFVVIDEAHRVAGKIYDSIVKHYREKGAKILLLTATPMRGDGRGLKEYADVMVCAPGPSWLMQNGYLCPKVDYRVGIIPDVKGVKLIAGEYNQVQLEEVMDGKLLIGDIVENWLAYGSARRTMLFASGVKTSRHMVEQFIAHGVRAVHVDGDTPKEERDEIYTKSNRGEIQIVSSAEVYSEGTDFPWIDCIIHAKPWKSLVKYLQQGGRGMRAWPGKTDLLFLDHSGVVFTHGRLELDREWELTESKEMLERMDAQRKKTERVQINCPQCGFILDRPICQRCGFQFVPQGEANAFLPGMLLKMTQEQFDNAMKPNKKKASEPDRQEWYSGFLGLAEERGKTQGWAAFRYKLKFGEWPPRALLQITKEPSQMIRKYDQYQRLRYIKGKQKSERVEA